MYLSYTPEGQETQRFHYEPGKVRTSESEAIEDRTGLSYGGDFKIALLKGSMRARRALLWTFLRRQHPTMRYEDVDFADGEVTLELDTDEVQAELDALATSSAVPEDDRRVAEAIYREQLKTAPAPPGKAEAPASETNTA